MQWAKDNDVLNKVLFVPPQPCYKRKDFPWDMVWLGPKKERFPCLMLFPEKHKVHYVMIYFHGNGCDLGGIHQLLRVIMIRLQIGIIAVEYPGYGLSEGTVPCESSVKNCGKLALEFVANDLKVPLDRVVIFGTSIGTGIASWLAKKVYEEKRELGALVLQSPFISIKSLIKQVRIFKSSVANFFAQVGSTFIADRFNNMDALRGVGFPLLVLHGAADELIPASHGKVLFDASCADLKQLFIFPKVGHNDFDWNVVIAKLRGFLECVGLHYGHEKKFDVIRNTPQISAMLKGPSGDVERKALKRARSGLTASTFFSSAFGTIFGSAVGIAETLTPETKEEERPSRRGSTRVVFPRTISISRNQWENSDPPSRGTDQSSNETSPGASSANGN